MNKLKVIVLTLGFSGFFLNVALAQEGGGGGSRGSGNGSFILSGNFGAHHSKNQTANAVTKDTKISNTDAQVGYVFTSGIYIGGIYGTSKMEIKDATSKPKMIHSGGSIGYMTSGGLFLIGHYFTEAKIEMATATADRTKGKGSQIDLGFVKNIWGPLFVGAQISKRDLEYEELDTAGTVTASEHEVHELFPAIRLSIIW